MSIPPSKLTTSWFKKRQSKAKTVPGILVAARRLLERDGRARGCYVSHGNGSYKGDPHNQPVGCMCISGAVRIAALGPRYVGGFFNEECQVGKAFAAIAKTVTNGEGSLHPEGTVVSYNDDTTDDQKVLDMLDRAIKEYKN